MARFERDGIGFDVPDDWRGMSIVSVTKPIAVESPDVCNVLVTQEPLGAPVGDAGHARADQAD